MMLSMIFNTRLNTRLNTRALVVLVLALSSVQRSHAQSGATSAPTSSTIVGPTAGPAARVVIDRARALVESGKGSAARTLLDSLVNASTNEPGDLADALYWRAVLGDRAADAERDWKRMVMDVPLSPRVPMALLRLGELEMVRGHPAGARTYLERLLRDYNSADERPKALLWVVRSYFDERDVARACRTLIVLRDGDVPDGELRLQANELKQRCRNEVERPLASVGATDIKNGEQLAANRANVVIGPELKPVAAAGKPEKKGDGKEAVKAESNKDATRYGVQIAAYDTRAQANAVVQKMTKRGLSAHVDGDSKPYRVRIGRYATRKEAEAALARLKRQGQQGFVTVLSP